MKRGHARWIMGASRQSMFTGCREDRYRWRRLRRDLLLSELGDESIFEGILGVLQLRVRSAEKTKRWVGYVFSV